MFVFRHIRVARQRLRSLLGKKKLDDQLDQELSFHVEQLVLENLAAGMTDKEARQAAHRTFGNLSLMEEDCRDQRRVNWFHDFWQDLRYGLRILGKNRGFTAIAATSLALGIGANTAILGVVGSLLLASLPLPDGDRLVVVRTFPSLNPRQGTNA